MFGEGKGHYWSCSILKICYQPPPIQQQNDLWLRLIRIELRACCVFISAHIDCKYISIVVGDLMLCVWLADHLLTNTSLCEIDLLFSLFVLLLMWLIVLYVVKYFARTVHAITGYFRRCSNILYSLSPLQKVKSHVHLGIINRVILHLIYSFSIVIILLSRLIKTKSG